MKTKIKPQDNASNQKNANKGTEGVSNAYKKKQENRSNSLNPNNDVFWKARGFEKRPKNWKNLIK